MTCPVFIGSISENDFDVVEYSSVMNMVEFYSDPKGYSHCFAELLKNYTNLNVSDIFKSLINTSSIDDFISKLFNNKKINISEIENVKFMFLKREPLNSF